MDGCDWPVLTDWEKIPARAAVRFSNPCRVDVHAQERRALRPAANFVVVRPTACDAQGPHPVMPRDAATWTAYNDWGGANHYFGTWGPDKNEGSPILSLQSSVARAWCGCPKGAARITVAPFADMKTTAPRFSVQGMGLFRRSGASIMRGGRLGGSSTRQFRGLGRAPKAMKFDIHHPRPTCTTARNPSTTYSCLVTVGMKRVTGPGTCGKTVETLRRAAAVASRGFGRQISFGRSRLEENGRPAALLEFKGADDWIRCATIGTQASPDRNRGKRGVNWPGAVPRSASMVPTACYGSWGRLWPRGSNGGFTVYRPEHWAFSGTDLALRRRLRRGGGYLWLRGSTGLATRFRQGLPYPGGSLRRCPTRSTFSP